MYHICTPLHPAYDDPFGFLVFQEDDGYSEVDNHFQTHHHHHLPLQCHPTSPVAIGNGRESEAEAYDMCLDMHQL
jgi:hypothetical protein